MKTALCLGLVAVGVYALVLRERHRALVLSNRTLCREVGAHYMEALLS